MVVIELDGLSMSDAEEALVEIWSCLEEYDVPSPRIAFTFHADVGVSMELSVDEPLWAEMVTVRLSHWLTAAQVTRFAPMAPRLVTREVPGNGGVRGPQARAGRRLSDVYFPATRAHDLILHVKRR